MAFEIFQSEDLIFSEWLANSDSNFFSIQSPLINDSIIAIQQLYEQSSISSASLIPSDILKLLTIVESIYLKSKFVIIRDIVINANVVIFQNDVIIGYARTAIEDVIIDLENNQILSIDDNISAL